MLRGCMMMLLSCFLLFVPAAIYSTQISYHGCDPSNNKYFKQYPVTRNDGLTEWLPYKYYGATTATVTFTNFAGWNGEYFFTFDHKKGISDSGIRNTISNFGSFASYGACSAGTSSPSKFCIEEFEPDAIYLTGGEEYCYKPYSQRGMRLLLCFGSGGHTADWVDCKAPSNQLTIAKGLTESMFSSGQNDIKFCSREAWCWDCNPNSDPDPYDETNCVCKSGYYTEKGENLKSAYLQCHKCKPGTYFLRQPNDDDGTLTSVWDDCTNCPENTYAPAYGDGVQCLKCPLHSSSKERSVSCECEPGYYAASINGYALKYWIGLPDNPSITECSKCEAKFYCGENRIFSEQVICPPGFYCPAGTIKPKICPAGSSCARSSSANVSCSKGYYSMEGWERCQKCPPGTFCPEQSSYPQNCTAGYYCPDGGDKKQCVTSGMYCGPGQSSESFCGGGNTSDLAYVSVPPRDSEQTCRCKDSKVGLGCKLTRCPDAMPSFFSLGSLLLNSDVTLQQFTKSYSSSDEDTIKSADVYLKNLINSIDENGDTEITSEEMQYMLKVKSISNFDTTRYVWCKNPTSGCYTTSVSVRTMYSNALENFNTPPFHIFDGSGIRNDNQAPAITNFQATYPNPKFTNEECSNYNTLVGKVPPRVTWNFSSPMISRLNVCGYNNGFADPDFNAAARSTNDLRIGKLTSYFNRNSSSAKRVLCLVVNYQFVCTVALSYDGRPHDLSAALIDGGVAFTYLDTSIRETEFNIFIGPKGSSAESKSFVVGVNYPSFSCGRLSEHISFLDTKRKNSIGQLFEYGVVAIESDPLKATHTQTAMTIFPYRIPFFIRLSGQVTDRSGVGVPNVGVKVYHIDSDTGKRDTNIDFSPVATFFY